MKEKIGLYYKYIIEKLELWNDRIYYIMFAYLKIVVDLFFIMVVSQMYQYHYYEVYGNAFKYILSWTIYIVLIVMIPKEENSLKNFFLHVQLIIMVLPMLTLYAFTTNGSTKYMLLVTLAVILEIWILKKGKREYRPVRIKNMEGFVSAFILIAIPLATLLIMNYGGFGGLGAFNFETVYSIRENASYPAALSYVIMWCTNIIIPFYIVYCIEKKHYVCAVLLIIDDVILYMTLAQKAIYLSLVVILAVYFISKTGHLVKLMYLGISMALTGLIILYLVEKNGDINNLMVICVALLGDRFLYGPALNKFLYYQVFSTYPKLYFSDGMIGKCMGLTNLYKYGPGQMAFGYVWEGRYGESNSCTGYLGDGYAQLGIIGVLLGAVILALLIKYIDNYCNSIAFGILAAITALYVTTLNDNSLQTVFVSCGLFIFVALLAIYANPEEINGKERK